MSVYELKMPNPEITAVESPMNHQLSINEPVVPATLALKTSTPQSPTNLMETVKFSIDISEGGTVKVIASPSEVVPAQLPAHVLSAGLTATVAVSLPTGELRSGVPRQPVVARTAQRTETGERILVTRTKGRSGA